MTQGANRLEGLDGLRGVAALVVLVFHANLLFGGPQIVPHGYLAVDFFFALSGYVMARTYEARMAEGGGAAFMRQRLRRFWPLMLVGGALAFPILHARTGEAAWLVAAANLVFVPVFAGRDLFPLNGPYWSLFYELAANLAHALVIHRLSNRQLTGLVVLLAAALAVLAAANGGLSLGTNPRTFLAGFVRVGAGYGIGVLLYRLWRDRPPLRVPAWATALLLPLAIALANHWALELAFVLVAVPLAIAGGLALDLGHPARVVGAISFPLYVIHLPLLTYCRAAGLPQLAAIALALGASWGVTRGFDALAARRKAMRAQAMAA